MTATAQTIDTSFVTFGTKALVDAIASGSDAAKAELLRRAAKGSRFANRACKKLGLIPADSQVRAAGEDTGVPQSDDAKKIIEALREASAPEAK